MVLFSLMSCEDVINDPDEDLQRKGILINTSALQQSWDLTEYFDQGQIQSTSQSSLALSFNEDQTLLVQTSEGNTIGNWALAKAGKLLVIRINSSDEITSTLNDDWVVLKLDSNELQIAAADLEEDTRFTFARLEKVLLTEEIFIDYWQLASFQQGTEEINIKSLIVNLAMGNQAEVIRSNGLTETGSWQLNAQERLLKLELGNHQNSGKLLTADWLIEEVKEDTLIMVSGTDKAVFSRFKDELPLLSDFLEHSWTVQNIAPLPEEDPDEFPGSELNFENGIITWIPFDEDKDDEEENAIGSYTIKNLQLTISFEEDDDDDEGYWNGQYTIEALTGNELKFSNDDKSITLKR